MKAYELINLRIIFFDAKEIITNSLNENVDDLGGWNSDWF